MTGAGYRVAVLALVVADLVVLTLVGLFSDPSPVAVVAGQLADALPGDPGSLLQDVTFLEGVVYALLLVPLGATLPLWVTLLRPSWWVTTGLLACGVVGLLALSAADVPPLVSGGVVGMTLGIVAARSLVPQVGQRRNGTRSAGGPGAHAGRTVLAAVVGVTMVATVVATVGLLADEDGSDPLATTPVAAATRQAEAKDLQVGLSYGGRLVGMGPRRLARSLDRAVELGAHWVRTDLEWGLVAGAKDQYDWSAFDRVVDAVNQRGLKLMPILLGTPQWARLDSCSSKWNCPPRDVTDLADFAGAAAARYTSRGVTTWQIWNEPNIDLFWLHPDPPTYAAMLERAAGSIRGANPSATIVFGGLAALKASPHQMEARDFLRQVCDEGVCDEMDVFAYHPYTFPDLPSDPSSADGPWARIAKGDNSFTAILDHYGLDDVPIWLTEFGAPTGGNGAASDGNGGFEAGEVDHVTEERQAQIAYDSVPSAVVTPRVKMLIWYTDVDLPEISGRQGHFGLFHADGSPKPAWAQLRRSVARFTR
jgi:hypothetical protein